MLPLWMQVVEQLWKIMWRAISIIVCSASIGVGILIAFKVFGIIVKKGM